MQILKLKIDLHVHTENSSDAHTRLDELSPSILRAGIDGLATTDHNHLTIAQVKGALVIPGIEISSRDGHIVGLGLAERIPRGLSGDETIQKIRHLGGVSIVVHPYDHLRSAVNPEKLTVLPDAIETINSASIFHSISWKRARDFAEAKRLPQTAGSDSHISETIGRAFTTIECNERSNDSLLAAIKNGNTVPHGRPIGLMDRIRKMVR